MQVEGWERIRELARKGYILYYEKKMDESQLDELVTSSGDCVKRSVLTKKQTVNENRENLILDITNKIICVNLDRLARDEIVKFLTELDVKITGRWKAMSVDELRSALANRVDEPLGNIIAMTLLPFAQPPNLDSKHKA